MALTPLFLALVLVEVTDLVFAVDSIPAIFGITLDPFIVFTSNAFAILGLRNLYFLLADAKERFYYLSKGLAVVLVWIGVKLVVPQDGEGEHNVDASASLVGAIKTIIVADAVMSLDNVIAVAAAAHGSMLLVAFGIFVSIPIVVNNTGTAPAEAPFDLRVIFKTESRGERMLRPWTRTS